MVRHRLSIALAMLLASVAPAPAQQIFHGAFTGFIGAGTGGDVRTAGVTPGVSLSVVDRSGTGAELDLGHTRSFDTSRFAESGITTLTVNAVVSRVIRERVQPYGLAGVGLMRVRVCTAECGATSSRTDWALDAGGGASYLLNDVWGIRGDVRYFRYFQRHTDVPLTDNGFFDFWRLSVGATFTWPIR